MQVIGSLRDLEVYILEEKERGREVRGVYEAVQQTEGALVRVYLMVTAGSAYAKSGEVSAKEVMNDILEMVKAIQNPIRGLFLRYYMLKSFKDVFSDKSSLYGEYNY